MSRLRDALLQHCPTPDERVIAARHSTLANRQALIDAATAPI
ncbi:MAG TPA: hypothetical protein VFW04_14235 [Gemmatimonadaceae bacterium]|nr:hypothetical protein [Gemmatimonadaceae bacterium]